MIMHTRNLVSSIALVAALSFSGGAMAQTMIGGVDIPPEDLDRVQAHCNTLAAAENESLAETADDDDAANGDDDGDDAQADPDPAADDGEASDMENALTSIDLDTVTLEQCREAGLIE
jgi:hypothetical protein